MRPNETQLISPCQVNCISSGSVCLSQFESLSFKHGYVEECKVLYAHAKQKNLKTKRLPLPSKQWSHTFQFLLETFIMELQQSFPLQPHAVALCHIVLTRVFNLSWDFSKWRIHRFFRNLLSLVHKCMTHYTSFILIVSAVLHVWQFDPLLYWQCPRFSLKKKKSLIYAFLWISIIVTKLFMKIVEEISPKADPFMSAQECFCFHLQCGNPHCVFVTKAHLSRDPSPDTTFLHNSWDWLQLPLLVSLTDKFSCDCHSKLLPWPHQRESLSRHKMDHQSEWGCR